MGKGKAPFAMAMLNVIQERIRLDIPYFPSALPVTRHILADGIVMTLTRAAPLSWTSQLAGVLRPGRFSPPRTTRQPRGK